MLAYGPPLYTQGKKGTCGNAVSIEGVIDLNRVCNQGKRGSQDGKNTATAGCGHRYKMNQSMFTERTEKLRMHMQQQRGNSP